MIVMENRKALKNKHILVWLLLLPVAIFLKSNLTSQNINMMERTFTEVYNDRLVAESYIYELTNLLYQKRILFLDSEGKAITKEMAARLTALTREINAMIRLYEKTKLTAEETRTFEKFKSDFASFSSHESRYFSVNNKMPFEELSVQFEKVVNDLSILSDIQISEAKVLKNTNEKIALSSQLAEKLDWAILFVLAVLLFNLVRKGLFSTHPLSHLMN